MTVHYDPMIAKLIVWAENRAEALRKLQTKLGDYHVSTFYILKKTIFKDSCVAIIVALHISGTVDEIKENGPEPMNQNLLRF